VRVGAAKELILLFTQMAISAWAGRRRGGSGCSSTPNNILVGTCLRPQFLLVEEDVVARETSSCRR
jgi:hypothetical protein